MSVKQVMFPTALQHKKQMPKLEDQTQHQANFHAGKSISDFSSSKIQEQEQTGKASESCLPIENQESMEIQQHMNHQNQTLAGKEIRSNKNTKKKDFILRLYWSKLQITLLEMIMLSMAVFPVCLFREHIVFLLFFQTFFTASVSLECAFVSTLTILTILQSKNKYQRDNSFLVLTMPFTEIRSALYLSFQRIKEIFFLFFHNSVQSS